MARSAPRASASRITWAARAGPAARAGVPAALWILKTIAAAASLAANMSRTRSWTSPSERAPFSPGYAQYPEHRPFAAFDGNPGTAWVADRLAPVADRWLQIGFVLVAVIVLVKPLGLYMARVFSGERTFLSPVLGPIEQVASPTDIYDRPATLFVNVAVETLIEGRAAGDRLSRLAEVAGVSPRDVVLEVDPFCTAIPLGSDQGLDVARVRIDLPQEIGVKLVPHRPGRRSRPRGTAA